MSGQPLPPIPLAGVDDGRLVGIVSLKDLLGFLDLKLELENIAQSKK